MRREIGALRKVHHPNVVKVFWADKTTDWRLVPHHGIHRRRVLDDYATGKKHLRDREAIDVALDVLDALVAIHPDTARLERARPARSARASCRKPSTRSGVTAGERACPPRHQAAQHHAHAHRREAARLQHRVPRRRPGTNPVSGTPPYQAPDADLTRWDVSTDLFAVGVVLYELLCDGQHPYLDSRPIAGDPVIDPTTIRSDLGDDLARFLLKACASLRDERFASARDMKDELDSLRQG